MSVRLPDDSQQPLLNTIHAQDEVNLSSQDSAEKTSQDKSIKANVASFIGSAASYVTKTVKTANPFIGIHTQSRLGHFGVGMLSGLWELGIASFRMQASLVGTFVTAGVAGGAALAAVGLLLPTTILQHSTKGGLDSGVGKYADKMQRYTTQFAKFSAVTSATLALTWATHPARVVCGLAAPFAQAAGAKYARASESKDSESIRILKNMYTDPNQMIAEKIRKVVLERLVFKVLVDNPEIHKPATQLTSRVFAPINILSGTAIATNAYKEAGNKANNTARKRTISTLEYADKKFKTSAGASALESLSGKVRASTSALLTRPQKQTLE